MNWKYSNVKHQPLLKIARARPGENFNLSTYEVGESVSLRPARSTYVSGLQRDPVSNR